MSLRTGVRLGDRYELVGRIAVGGMGEVWKGRDTTLQRIVAVKVLRSEYTGDATFVARFRTEARNTAMLSHLNIAQVYDYGEAMAEGEHVAYLVMELIDGQPMSTVLQGGVRLPAPRVLDILGQTAAGLGVAHAAGVVHRDVKPANLILRPDRVVKITDFGISRAADHVPLTGTGMVVGTAQYLSPEQAMGRPVTPASDIYALGVVGYEALTGRRPFDGQSSVSVALAHVNQQPAPLPADVPGPVRELIHCAMSKDARQRYPDGAAFASAVRAVSQGRSPRRPAGVPVPAAGLASTRVLNPAGGLAGAAGGAGAGAALAGGATRGGKRPTARMPAVRADRSHQTTRPPAYAPAPRAPRAPQKRRTGQYATVLVLVALLIAGALLAVYLVQNKDSLETATPTDAPVTSLPAEEQQPAAEPEPEPVFIDTQSLAGRPVDEVEAELIELGLVVNTEQVDASLEELQALGVEDQSFNKDDVITTDPFQAEVSVGSTVTVYYARKNYEPVSEEEDEGGNG